MLVGRDGETARIEEVLDGARRGAGGALVLHGDAGSGKTTLLTFARERAGAMTVLAARGVESESELPFAGLLAVLHPVLDRLERLPEHRRRALAGALGLVAPEPVEPFAVYAATLDILAALAEEAPLLVLVDDAHWLDAPSGNALAFAARRLGDDPVLLLFTARDAEPLAFPILDLPALHIGALSPDACGALVERRVGRPVRRDVAERLRQATEGNPLALTEAAPRLTPAQLRGVEPLDEPLAVGAALEQAFGRRVAALARRPRQALLVAAASDNHSAGVLEAALADVGLTPAALLPAEEAGLVSLDRGTVRFRHPLVRSAVYHGADPGERRRVHRALAMAMDPREMRRAWHLAAAATGPDESVAAELDGAAVEARGRASPAVAAKAAEAAARLSPGADGRRRRLVAAAADLFAAGTPDRAEILLDEALGHAADPVARAEVQHLRARVRLLRGSAPAVRELLITEASAIKELDPRRAARMLLDATITAIMTGEPRVALALAREGRSLGRQAGGVEAVLCDVMLGAAMLLRGKPGALELICRAEEVADEGGIVVLLAAHQRVVAGDYERGLRNLETVVRGVRAAGAISALPMALASFADALFLVGRMAAARAAAAEALALSEETGQPAHVAHALCRMVAIDGVEGYVAEARSRARQAVAVARRHETTAIETLAGAALGLLELGAGRLDEAVAELDATGRMALERGLEEPGIAMWASDLAEAHARRGDRDRAAAALEVLDRQAHATGRELALAAAGRCHGLLADGATFDRHFAGALERHASLPVPFERARTQLCYGERLRRARRRVQAREQLRAALETFEALGARPWAERARTELAATGERARPRRSEALDRLTPQELQVALLIAEGATNREAAAALFVSPRTVEAHLGRVYRKLGLRSRTELAARVTRGDVGADIGIQRKRTPVTPI